MFQLIKLRRKIWALLLANMGEKNVAIQSVGGGKLMKETN
jgi:hypothetical protein